jgi:hypothetical protein
MFYNKNKKGQVWTADFIVGLLLFVLMMLVSIKIVFDMYPSQDSLIVYRDAVHLSDNLLSEGYPANWSTNLNDVILPGVAENNRINNTKLSNFNNITYNKAKTLMHVTSDYIFFIHNSTTVINTGHCVYGYPLTTDVNCNPVLTTQKYENLARIDRVVIYNSTVMMMTIYTWH